MKSKNSYITVTDQFCGAGGSSQGVRNYANKTKGGVEVKLALNHWALAIKTHEKNFPDTLHECTDVSACDPRRYPATDILITSPECTNHSLAKGQKQVKSQLDLYDKRILDPAAERSRATMWDVPRFAEYHNYNIIIVENVIDARKWVMFDAWLMAMHALNYLHQCVYLNSMHCHPTPQSRDRMYVVFWKKGNKKPNLDITPLAFCDKCEKDISSVQSWKNPQKKFGVYGKRGQYVYCCPTCTTIVIPYHYAAFNCIDWSLKGERIGDKKLSPNSRRRIEYAYNKYGNKPVLITSRYGSGVDCRVRDLEKPMPTQPASIAHYLLNPLFVKMEHMNAADGGYVKTGLSPLPVQTTSMSMSLAIQPFMVNQTRTGIGKKIIDPCNTFTTVTKQAIISHEKINSFISYYYGTSQASHIVQAAGTFGTKTSHYLLQAPQADIPLDDYEYRMMQPHEVKIGMAFDLTYDVLGNKEQQVQQLGNAVTPPAMETLIQRCVESLS